MKPEPLLHRLRRYLYNCWSIPVRREFHSWGDPFAGTITTSQPLEDKMKWKLMFSKHKYLIGYVGFVNGRATYFGNKSYILGHAFSAQDLFMITKDLKDCGYGECALTMIVEID